MIGVLVCFSPQEEHREELKSLRAKEAEEEGDGCAGSWLGTAFGSRCRAAQPGPAAVHGYQLSSRCAQSPVPRGMPAQPLSPNPVPHSRHLSPPLSLFPPFCSGPMVINGASLPESLLEALGMPSGGGFQIKLVRSGACQVQLLAECQVQLQGRPAGPPGLQRCCCRPAAGVGTPCRGQQGELHAVKQVHTCLWHAPAGHISLYLTALLRFRCCRARCPGHFHR